MRSPTLLLIRMKAADTSASNAIADCTPLTVVSRSWTTAEIDTFMSDVSTTRTNIAIARRMASRRSPVPSAGPAAFGALVIGGQRTTPRRPPQPSCPSGILRADADADRAVGPGDHGRPHVPTGVDAQRHRGRARARRHPR